MGRDDVKKLTQRQKLDQSARADKAVAVADELCRERGVLLAGTKREVLKLLLASDKAMSAYDLLAVLNSDFDRNFTPPTVYRALDFLLKQRLISRLESVNAFIPCADPAHLHSCVFFICRKCGTSAEVENSALEALISRDAAQLSFHVDKQIVELQGTCATCQASS